MIIDSTLSCFERRIKKGTEDNSDQWKITLIDVNNTPGHFVATYRYDNLNLFSENCPTNTVNVNLQYYFGVDMAWT